jgi:acetylglutamate kinase
MERTLSLLDAVPYLRAYAGQRFVVKLGGELLEDPARRDLVARDLAVLHRLNIGVVVVHGGGPQLDAMTARLGLSVERVAGRRVTSEEVLEAAKMVFRGTLSLDLVAALLRHGEKAVGLSGVDGGLVQAVRRPTARVTADDGAEVTVDYGEVGDITGVDPSVVLAVLSAGGLPVVSPLAADADGRILNVNADTVAASLAAALGAAKLILLTRAPGLLRDADDPASLIHWTDLSELESLVEDRTLTGGMRPKAAAIRAAIEGGVPRVHVIDGRRDGALLQEIFTTEGCGTLIVAAAEATPAEPL